MTSLYISMLHSGCAEYIKKKGILFRLSAFPVETCEPGKKRSVVTRCHYYYTAKIILFIVYNKFKSFFIQKSFYRFIPFHIFINFENY